MQSRLFILIYFILIQPVVCQSGLTQFVNPFIGTDGNGHTFPGVVVPFGMVQLSPDTRTKTAEGSSGYHYSDKSIMGFSHTHLSGTGEGAGGDILLMPTTGKVKLDVGDPSNTITGYRSKFSHINEKASPGYYKVLLDDYNIIAELTTTKRVGLHKYTFQKSGSTNIILDLEHGINDKTDYSELYIISNTKITGLRSSVNGLRMYQKLYFVAEFSEPFISYGVSVEGKIDNNIRSAKGKSVKAYFKFENTKRNVLVKVSISKVDINGAEKNLTEIPEWDFDSVRQKSESVWNEELKKIEIVDQRPDLKTIFYTSLYHSSIHPSLDMDIDRRYRSTNNLVYTANKFTDYTNFSLWDTFRGLHPLHTIINPTRTNDFINTFIERYEHSGSLPMFEIFGNEVPSMIGYHSLPVIADAYVKRIINYDVSRAIKGMKELANLPWEKRNLYKTFGFVPSDYTVQSVSRTLEYCFDDWCLAQVVNEKNDYKYYSNRGNFYKNLFSKEINFMRPKNSRYQWLTPFNPSDFSKYFTQANAYQYTSFVPQDIYGLINKMGGEKNFEEWLDNFFSTEIKGHTGFIGQYNHGNEPSHHTGYLYNYVGTPWKTQKIIREILTDKYSNQPNGLSGNDDAGQLSAWYVLSAMGFYSVTPGMDYYVIGSPLFENVSINLENGKTFKIIANNSNLKNPYIQSVVLNSKPYSKLYIKHSDILNGGAIIFEMGETPNAKWVSKKEDRPYSIKYNSLSLPKIVAKSKQIPPDGIITFDNSCTVSIKSDDNNTQIYYTTDGSEPNTYSHLYKNKFKVTRSLTIKAKVFKNGMEPSYTTTLKFRELRLKPALDINNLEKGISYQYREVWLCKKVEDIVRYPILKKGVIPKIDANLGISISEKYGTIYSGFINIQNGGQYTFYVNSDDGSVLSIDNIMIVNNDGSHRQRERFGKIVLAKGFHSIIVKHFQVGGKPKLIVKWAGPGIQKEIIPESVFYYKHSD